MEGRILYEVRSQKSEVRGGIKGQELPINKTSIHQDNEKSNEVKQEKLLTSDSRLLTSFDAIACAAKFTELPPQSANNSEDIIKNRELLINTVKDLSVSSSKVKTLNSLKYPEFLPTNKRLEIINEQPESKTEKSVITQQSTPNIEQKSINYKHKKHSLTEKDGGKAEFDLNGKRPPLSPEILNKIEGQRMVNELAETLYAISTVNGDCFQDDNYQIRFDVDSNLLTITNLKTQEVNLAASYHPHNKIWYYRDDKVENMLSLTQFNSLKQKDSDFLYSVSISSYYDDFNKKRNALGEVIRQESQAVGTRGGFLR